MEARHREAIRRVFADVGKELEINKEFIMEFRTGDILTEHMADEILVERTKLGKAYKFLDTITKRGPTAFEAFIQALKSTGQSHIAKMIDPEQEFDHIKGKSSKHSSTSPLTPSAPPEENGYKATQSEPPNDLVGFENMRITGMDPTQLDKLRRIPDTIGAYKVRDRMPRGRAIILNNEKFTLKENREGSEYDVRNIDQLLQYFGYSPVRWENLTAQQIKEKISKEAQHASHEKSDSFIMVCMSHGHKGKLFGTDERVLNIDKDIVDPFDGNNCKHLNGKPKLFFIQACQGEGASRGTIKADGDEESGAAAASNATNQLEMDRPDATVFQKTSSHEKADIFKFYATVPGYKAFRNTAHGSWFMHDLVKAICEHSHEMDIGRIATRVNHAINERATMSDGFKQMSQMRSSLTKEFYFAK